MENTKKNVIIAVRDADLRLSLDLLLREKPGLNVVGTATTSESALALIKAECPKLVFLEGGIPNGSTEDVLKEIKTRCQHLKVILLGKRIDQKQSALHMGADAYLLIGGAPNKILTAIDELLPKE